ncbi:MAG: hypothetical protein IV090_26710 [Candidatus Sericytochromatia bacterium]|nr:hypothetical protein [Candidatus Sericytochromatia bacterium]
MPSQKNDAEHELEEVLDNDEIAKQMLREKADHAFIRQVCNLSQSDIAHLEQELAGKGAQRTRRK